MKLLKVLILVWVVALQLACSKTENSEAPTPNIGTPKGLAVAKNQNMDGAMVYLEPTIIYSSMSKSLSAVFTSSAKFFQKIPEGFDDSIESFTLDKGFMVTFAENEDGTGEAICYVAAVSNITVNLPARLSNKVSFIRFIPVVNTLKKGTGNTNINAVNSINSTWFYNWGLGASSTPNQQYIPMTWGKNAASFAQSSVFIAQTGIDHLLTFNEPDNPSQSNIASIDTAINRYQQLLYTGLRMGSPATEQDNALASKWLNQFVKAADSKKLRVDFLALHWYDWGNQTAKADTDSLTSVGILNRFKNYISRIRTIYPDKQLWITEYNANPTRSVEIHRLFMKMSAEWLNSQNYVERFAYFFPSTIPATNPDFTLTSIGQTWANLSSAPSFGSNIVPQ